ncbi:transposase [Chryseobacterium sp. MYb7]|uniref:transposase n=1 Tax=Chryseobacterium sp. MYb7 TaxID=1827290 RepID=UPI000D00189C|nr:transposase [Chryseobacterium sp. MYb7]PRB04569.1 transposase [Chryseobacterium sp. MYb7]
MNFKKNHIGSLLKIKVAESGIDLSRICNFIKCDESDVQKMYNAESLDTEILLKWSKLLEYDFFRIYTQHLILYAPSPRTETFDKQQKLQKSELPQFRKNIYTKEIIDFILERISTGEMTKLQVINEYKIPKTTLYKWISKY